MLNYNVVCFVCLFALLYIAIIAKGRKELAIDVGAGTGQASVPLTKYFKKVIAYDPSPGKDHEYRYQ